MFHAFFRPAHRRCSDCGATVNDAAFGEHVCDPEQWLDHQMVILQDDVAALTDEIHAYLASPEGRFDVWWAERGRLANGEQER